MAKVVLGTFTNSDFDCDVSECSVSEGEATKTIVEVSFDDDVLGGISIKSPPTSTSNQVKKRWDPRRYGVQTGRSCTSATAESFKAFVAGQASSVQACSGNTDLVFTTGSCSLTVSGSVTVVYRNAGNEFGGKTSCGNSGSITKSFSFHAPYLTGPQSTTLQKESFNMEQVDEKGNKTIVAQPRGRGVEMAPNCQTGIREVAYVMETCSVCGIPFGDGGQGSKELCKGTGNGVYVFGDAGHTAGTAVDNGYPTAGLASAAAAAVAGQAVAAFGSARANAIAAYQAALAAIPDPSCGKISVSVSCSASVGCF